MKTKILLAKSFCFKMKTDLYFLTDIFGAIKNHVQTMSAPIYIYRITVETELGFYKRLAKVSTKGKTLSQI